MDKTWDLTPLYASFDSPEFKRDFEKLKATAAAFADETRAMLAAGGTDAQKLEAYINREQETEWIQNIGVYAFLTIAVDANNEEASRVIDTYHALSADFKLAQTIFEQFVAELTDLGGIIASSALLREHEFYLRSIVKRAKHRLPEQEEFVMAKMNATGGTAWELLHSSTTANHMVPIIVKGEAKRLPLAAVRNMYYDADADDRRAAYDAELASYPAIERPVAFALNAIKGEALTFAELRGYASPLAMTLFDSRMEQKTLDALIGAIEEYLPKLRPFYHKKGEMLGHKNGLPFYDIFAPVGKADMRFTFEEAADYVVKNFTSFSKQLGDYARMAADKRWIDVFPREGKRGGAFCANIHALKESRFMLNFDGSFSDVTTLAHELGHGYHGHRLDGESALNSDYTMPIAETASTMCETIIKQAALKTATDAEKLIILENSITDALQVVVDIYSRFTFEGAIIEKRKGGSLSAAEFKEEMTAAQKKAYGDSLDPEYLHPYMWINKGHYYNSQYNFYNFPYAYGQLFALGLYAQYEKEGAAFAGKYDALLTATGKNSLEDVARIAGIDVTDKAFWRSSLDVVLADVEKFCRL